MKHPCGARALLAAILVAVALGATAINGTVAVAAPVAQPAEIVANPDEGEPPDTAGGEAGGEQAPDLPDAAVPTPAPALAPDQQKVEPRQAAPGLAASGPLDREIVSYGPREVPAGWVWWQKVYCPTGKRAVNGGESNTSPGGIVLTHTGPTPSTGEGWIVNVRNTSQVAANLTVFAVCVGNLEVYRFTEGAHQFPGPGQTANATATCTTGVPVGGGFWPQPQYGVTVGSIWPRDPLAENSKEWVNTVTNIGSETADVWPYVVCATPVDEYLIGYGPSVTLPAGGYVSATSTCPQEPPLASPTLLGGGAVVSRGDLAVITDSYPEAGNTWKVYVRSRASFDMTIKVRAVCAAG